MDGFPSIHGNLNLTLPPGSSGTPNIQINPSSYLSDLQFAGMVTGQVRKGDYAIIYDVVYADLSGKNSKVSSVTGPGGEVTLPIDANVNSKFTSGIYTLGGGYTLTHSAQGSIDVIAGVRYAQIKASANWNLSGPDGIFAPSGSASQTVDLTDGIIGLQGHLALSDDGKWYMPFEVDIGAGSNNSSWNGIIGVGYRFGWGDVILAYRYLYYDMNDTKLIQNTSLGGPALGVAFRW